MVRVRSKIVVFVIMMMVGLLVFSTRTQAAGKTVYVGGSFALTGAYAEDMAAMLAAFEDYQNLR